MICRLSIRLAVAKIELISPEKAAVAYNIQDALDKSYIIINVTTKSLPQI